MIYLATLITWSAIFGIAAYLLGHAKGVSLERSRRVITSTEMLMQAKREESGPVCITCRRRCA
jgi:hypothetical protein